MFPNDHRAASDDSLHVRFTERLQERLNRANATPNDLPREGEKNVSFSICLLVVKVCHLDANSLIFPGDENTG